MAKTILAAVLLLSAASCFGQSMDLTLFGSDPNSVDSFFAQFTGQTDDRVGPGGVQYQCFSVPTAGPTFFIGGVSTTGTVSGQTGTVSHAQANALSTDFVSIPYKYNVGSMLCGAPKTATKKVTVAQACPQLPGLMGGWPRNSLIRVYINTNVATSGSAVAHGIMSGLSSWSFTNGNPLYSSPTFVSSPPTSPIKPYIYIHSSGGSGGSDSIFCDASGCSADMTVPSNMTGVVAQRFGAHEEGHNNYLANCDAQHQCLSPAGFSAMGPQSTSGSLQPTLATVCDIHWSNFYRGSN